MIDFLFFLSFSIVVKGVILLIILRKGFQGCYFLLKLLLHLLLLLSL